MRKEPLCGCFVPLSRPSLAAFAGAPLCAAGFTLIEMLVVCLLIGIFAMIALPDFAGMIKGERLVAQSNDLVSDIAFARAEAMRRGKRVTLCPTADQSSCSDDWARGRMVFIDLNRDLNRDTGDGAGEDVLRVRSSLTGQNRLTWSGASQRLQFLGSGLADGGITHGMVDTFRLCDSTQTDNGRLISVSKLGLVEVKREGVTCPAD